ncbi:MAG: hypothetical protein M1834_001832, partial [Cirrosporium novae-zelandiae]
TAPNCSFIVDDINESWTWDDDSLDIVHSRAITAGMANWKRLIEQSYQKLKPGGWVELEEFHFPFELFDKESDKHSPMIEWSQKMAAGLARLGILSETDILEKHLEAAGFVDIHKDLIKAGMGWPHEKEARTEDEKKWKKIGILSARDMYAGLPGMSLALFTKVLGWSRAQVEIYLVEPRKELREARGEIYLPM